MKKFERQGKMNIWVFAVNQKTLFTHVRKGKDAAGHLKKGNT